MTEKTIYQKGFTLIEVMVALVVLSIGLLGIAAMQLQGLKNAHSSYQRTIASIIAMDAGERLWVKLSEDGTISDTDVDAVETEWVNTWDSTRTPAVASNVIGLPLVVDSNNKTRIEKSGNEYTIWVFWQESRFEDEGPESSFNYVMNLLP